MKKLLALSAVFGSLVMVAPASHAVGTANFTVQTDLASVCKVVTGTDNQTLTVPAYTAFQAADAVSPTANIDFDCTRTLAGITGVFDASGTSKTSSAAATSPTGAGVLSNGLNYTLDTVGSSFAAGTAANATTIGTAQTYRFAVTATVPLGQAGTCSSGSCPTGTQARTLTLNF